MNIFISITQLGPKFTTLKDFGSLNNNTVSGENKNCGFFKGLEDFLSGIKSWVSNLDNNNDDEEEYPMDEGVVRSTNVVRRTKNSATIHSIIPKKSQTIPAITKMSIDRNRGNYIKTDAVVDEGLNGNNNNLIFIWSSV